jgi:biotin carboxyl carrier protein
MAESLKVKVKGHWYLVEVEDLSARPVRAVVDGHLVEVDVGSVTHKEPPAPAPPTAERPAPAPRAAAARATPPVPTSQTEPAPRSEPAAPRVLVDHPPSATKLFAAPMPGTILSIAVGVGDQVVIGDPVCVLEAMKMQQVLKAEWSGVVRAVHVVVGEQVSDGSPILELE